ncbi:zinc-finger homeodomain protein 8-like [Miscanthus floridulus]|uniref:zinc-finger homeodomain protein 8-like n=1 Tax=Miscanthus floridulus TaxID=154761 RepID=UPI00345A23DE
MARSGGGGAGGGKNKECMCNHTAAMGGQAFDGCGKYTASSPNSLKYTACGCHRSFHHRATLFPSSVPVPASPHLALSYHAVPNAAPPLVARHARQLRDPAAHGRLRL